MITQVDIWETQYDPKGNFHLSDKGGLCDLCFRTADERTVLIDSIQPYPIIKKVKERPDPYVEMEKGTPKKKKKTRVEIDEEKGAVVEEAEAEEEEELSDTVPDAFAEVSEDEVG